jgi:hypothetical protein
MVRLPGIEPGPSRWQRDIITTRLKAHISVQSHSGNDPSTGEADSKKAPRRGIEPRASA